MTRFSTVFSVRMSIMRPPAVLQLRRCHQEAHSRRQLQEVVQSGCGSLSAAEQARVRHLETARPLGCHKALGWGLLVRGGQAGRAQRVVLAQQLQSQASNGVQLLVCSVMAPHLKVQPAMPLQVCLDRAPMPCKNERFKRRV